MEIVDLILGELKAQGCRRSAAREALLRILATADSPLSVPDMERCLASSPRRFNKTTVYREIEVLKTAGYVSELTLRNGAALYELTRAHHHHLVCVECGSVRDVEVKEEAWECEERRIGKREGFHILDHSLEFFGLCGRCRPEGA